MLNNLSDILKISKFDDFDKYDQKCTINDDLKNTKYYSISGLNVNKFNIKEKLNHDNEFLNLDRVRVKPVDCLACRGCVTETETVLLDDHSVEEAITQINDNTKTVIISLAPQTRSALAACYKTEPGLFLLYVSKILSAYGVNFLLDTTSSRDMSLIETFEDFFNRYKVLEISSHLNCTKSTGNCHLPLLCSSCPGFVFFAEKTQGGSMTKFLSSVKSPQSMIGNLIKRWLVKQKGLCIKDVFHVASMPCYDRKLEACSKDLQNHDTYPATDCVLVTTEILHLFNRLGIAIEDKIWYNAAESNHSLKSWKLGQPPGGFRGTSGGYLEFVFRNAVYR
jgi:iron only hydrogenase large subunit-like protein